MPIVRLELNNVIDGSEKCHILLNFCSFYGLDCSRKVFRKQVEGPFLDKRGTLCSHSKLFFSDTALCHLPCQHLTLVVCVCVPVCLRCLDRRSLICFPCSHPVCWSLWMADKQSRAKAEASSRGLRLQVLSPEEPLCLHFLCPYPIDVEDSEFAHFTVQTAAISSKSHNAHLDSRGVLWVHNLMLYEDYTDAESPFTSCVCVYGGVLVFCTARYIHADNKWKQIFFFLKEGK